MFWKSLKIPIRSSVDFAKSVFRDISDESIEYLKSLLVNFFDFKNPAHLDLSPLEIKEIYAHLIPSIIFLQKIFNLDEERSIDFLESFLELATQKNWNQINAGYFIVLKNLQEYKENDTGKRIERMLKNNSSLERFSIILEEYYNPFIQEFDKKKHKRRGIIFTPSIISQFIIKAVDNILVNHFGLEEGIFSANYDFYDPAVGPLTFESCLLDYFLQKNDFPSEENRTIQWKTPIYGNEINPASYYIGLLVLKFLYPKEITRKFMTNFRISFQSALSPENSEKFFQDKKSPISDKPIIVIGNPPYSVSSANKNPWITELMKRYAVPEPNLTRLYDDYVKFFRYGEWMIEQRGQGLLALITNRKFLDGKIFYGFRKSLALNFDKIFIIDLFGDLRNPKHKTALNNLFGIQTGICISLCFKLPKKFDKSGNEFKTSEKEEKFGIFYQPIIGSEKEILSQLKKGYSHLSFRYLPLKPPQFLFVPLKIAEKDQILWQKFGISLPNCFFKSSRALISSRDRFMTHISSKQLRANVDLLERRDYQELRKRGRIRKKFDLLLEDESIISTFNFEAMKNNLFLINYRPFDIRYTIFYTINRRCGKSTILDLIKSPKILWFETINQGKLKEISHDSNWIEKIAFNFVQSVQKPPFRHIWVTSGLADSGLFGYSTSKIAPWYLDDKLNISEDFLQKWNHYFPNLPCTRAYYFIYGLLMSNEYGNRFLPFLLHEYPRIILLEHSLAENQANNIIDLGEKLVKLHLGDLNQEDWFQIQKLKADLLEEEDNSWITASELQSFSYSEKNKALLLNFWDSYRKINHNVQIPLSISLWEFKIGSVMVLKNWLNARLIRNMEKGWNKKILDEFIGIYFVIGRSIEIISDLDKEVEKYLTLTPK